MWKKISLGTNVQEIEKKIKHKSNTKIFNGLYNIFYINKTLTDQCLNVISLNLKELFPFMEIVLQFDRVTFEGVVSLKENRTAVLSNHI